MSGEVERMARLLVEAEGFDPCAISVIWASKRRRYLTNIEVQMTRSERLHAAGLALVPREPDEATVERVADAVMHSQGYSEDDIDFYGDRPTISPVRQHALDTARAACRAMVEE